MRKIVLTLALLCGLALEAGPLTALERTLAIAVLRSTKKMLNRNGIDRHLVGDCLERAKKVILTGEGTEEDWAMVRRGIEKRREWQKIQSANNRAFWRNCLRIPGTSAGKDVVHIVKQLDAKNILVEVKTNSFNPLKPFRQDVKNFKAVINHDFERRYQKNDQLPGMLLFLTNQKCQVGGVEYPVFVVGLDRARRLLDFKPLPEPIFE